MVRPASFPPQREIRVSFADRLTDAVAVPVDLPLPPLRPAPVAEPVVVSSEPAPTPAAPTDLWVTEIGVQLTADRKAIETVLESVQAATSDLRQEHTARMGEWRTAAVELALSIAAKLLHERVAANDFAIEEIVRGMIGDMHEDEVVSVRLNPRDLELLENRLGGQPLLSGPTDPRLMADPTLGRGECRVEGKASVSLSDLPRQLTQIRDDLLRSIAHARS